MNPKTEAERAAKELDHPCKQICSGWKQGYEKGFHEGQSSERVKKLIEALKYISKNAHEMDRYIAKKALAEFEGSK